MKTMKLNIDLGKYVITGTKHDLILSERGIIKEGENAGKETLSRIGYYSKFEHLVKELCNREILLSQAQTLQDIQQHIETLGVSLSMAIDQFGNDSNLLIVFYVQIMPDDFVMQLHRF